MLLKQSATERIDMAFKFDLLQVVEDFTRMQGNSASIIDRVFVSGTSVFTQDDDVLPNFDADYPPMPDIVISECGILNMLLKLDVKRSPGPDGIPNAFLSRYAEWV